MYTFASDGWINMLHDTNLAKRMGNVANVELGIFIKLGKR